MQVELEQKIAISAIKGIRHKGYLRQKKTPILEDTFGQDEFPKIVPTSRFAQFFLSSKLSSFCDTAKRTVL